MFMILSLAVLVRFLYSDWGATPFVFLMLYHVERHSRLQGGRPINKYCRSSFPRVGSSRNNIVIGHVISET